MNRGVRRYDWNPEKPSDGALVESLRQAADDMRPDLTKVRAYMVVPDELAAILTVAADNLARLFALEQAVIVMQNLGPLPPDPVLPGALDALRHIRVDLGYANAARSDIASTPTRAVSLRQLATWSKVAADAGNEIDRQRAVIEAQERTIADLTDEIDRLIDRQSEAHG